MNDYCQWHLRVLEKVISVLINVNLDFKNYSYFSYKVTFSSMCFHWKPKSFTSFIWINNERLAFVAFFHLFLPSSHIDCHCRNHHHRHRHRHRHRRHHHRRWRQPHVCFTHTNANFRLWARNLWEIFKWNTKSNLFVWSIKQMRVLVFLLNGIVLTDFQTNLVKIIHHGLRARLCVCCESETFSTFFIFFLFLASYFCLRESTKAKKRNCCCQTNPVCVGMCCSAQRLFARIKMRGKGAWKSILFTL